MAAKKRKKSKKKPGNSKLTLFLLVGVLVLGGYFMMTGNDPLGLFEGIKETVAPEPVVESATKSDWWEVYFVDYVNHNDPEHYEGTIEEEIIKKIDEADESIHIASFEFDLTPVADALIRAHERGVDVRWVTDDEHGIEADEDPGGGQFEMLEDEGIEIRDDQRGALMHNKFWIFDRKIVWTGSTNITESGIFKQDNNVIVIHSEALAEIYEREFDEMWNGEFGIRSTSTADQQSVVVEGTQLQAFFAAEDDVIDNHIIPIIEQAQSSVHFMAFSFTHDSLEDAMTERFENGVDVIGIYEKTGSSTVYSELGDMYCSKMKVRRDGNGSFLHHKVIVVDERIVITGSLNFSDNATESNDENILIVDNAEIAALYIQEVNRVWDMASDPEPDKFKCE
ncbi:MAG: phosphatidylserine/phosphatidylglycerophosphate/cardiolipin synthase family protein [Anaerolineae bacterium]|jgi:phosphatidylserine/phosphatidylglycerophosphate/cardiolipin synthase-like enzyme|nr:phosphatidylserine/phosphatidylglycerophosphate/cardiolipin synthase family protein [Anaerolineae bacterium]MBT3712841.1 phosphatidylserine/phosphatidylglycerophosphate/cardiolipin synthase family protein [Anaerolineae bacterium]MBT4311448.1 phosphatidylserine/phosphatidylglycerophosphate/cardiolipin synthase family protein [Anaerolineae bacterium]MBT4458628.1 phosphatidylserine/phosphatidylglycerophosphate/cardiolipin synthase family protein [Anaerolineae bacterium]MBT6060107.1 phosphatidyl